MKLKKHINITVLTSPPTGKKGELQFKRLLKKLLRSFLTSLQLLYSMKLSPVAMKQSNTTPGFWSNKDAVQRSVNKRLKRRVAALCFP